VAAIEPLLMLAILRNRENYTKFSPALSKEFFPGELEAIHYAIGQYWKGYKGYEKDKVAAIQSLKVLARKKCAGKSAWGVVEDLFKRMEVMETNPPRTVVAQIQDYIIRQGLGNLALGISESVDRLNKPVSPELVKKQLDVLCGIRESVEDRGLEYLQAGTDYFKTIDAGRVSTGIVDVDKGIGGGLGAGELGIIIAPFGGGKTALLVNLGASAILQGKGVLHITLEIHEMMVAMRYDMRIGGFSTEELRNDPKLALRSRKKARNAKGSLHIYDRSHEALTILGVERLLENPATGRRPDLLIVDYADLLRSDRMLEGRRFELGEVYRELRRVAAKYSIPVWTASQATREAARNGEFDTSYIAEDISKAHTADAIICAIQTEEQRNAGQMILKVDKTRMCADKPSVTIGMDYRTMTIHPLREEEVVKEKVKKRVSKLDQMLEE
jgi:replicative DNA helicase